eukprot:8931564-Alexandrium_andersonii.AAC.1
MARGRLQEDLPAALLDVDATLLIDEAHVADVPEDELRGGPKVVEELDLDVGVAVRRRGTAGPWAASLK